MTLGEHESRHAVIAPVRGSKAHYGALRERGYEAYLAGGCVRDLLLGLRARGLRRGDERDAGRGAGDCSRGPLPWARISAWCWWLTRSTGARL